MSVRRVGPPLPSFEEQLCAIPREWRDLTRRGYFPARSGQISLLPKTPAYMASGGGKGWSHSGPWPYLQDIPLVFYGPGLIARVGDVKRPVTLADVAPTLATLLRGVVSTQDGQPLTEAARFNRRLLAGEPPRLIVVVVWDGGGWNVLDQWPNAWPNLRSIMRRGVSYTNATVGSSPSVTPPVHTTLGTGSFPWHHGITGVPVRDERGEVVDAFLKGESSRFIEVLTLAERWDERNGNRALVGMVGYEPWHLGMIGMGAERSTGDKDDAAWLNIETNEWTTNTNHYRLPAALTSTRGLERDLEQLDAADGETDGAWRDNAILDERDRIEETPAFIVYHSRALRNLIEKKGYGADRITDLLFTNFKQIDRVGHYFNMASDEVRDSVVESDRQLGVIVDALDRSVGRGRWVVVVTADHGQQPDAEAIGGYGIDPTELEKDIAAEFGPVIRAVWPTEAFLLEDVMEERGVTVSEIARFIGDYRLKDNTKRPDMLVAGAGKFDPADRVFSMAIPSRMLADVTCGDQGRAGSPND